MKETQYETTQYVVQGNLDNYKNRDIKSKN